MKRNDMPVKSVSVYKVLLFVLVAFSSCSPSSTELPVENEKDETVISHKILVAGNEGERYFVDENNKPLFNGAKFYNVYDFKNGYCIVSKMNNGKELRGVIDSTGKEVIPCTFDAVLDNVEEGMVEFSQNGHRGYLNLKGQIVIPCEFTETKGFSDGLVKLEKNYRTWGIMDKNGKLIVPFSYQAIGTWGNDLAAVKKDGKWGFINRAGELTIPTIYNFAWGFEEGVCLVGKGKKFALINAKNEQLTGFDFDNYKSIVDVSKNEFSKTGYSQSNERLVMEEGLMVLAKNNLWGLFNTKGEEVLPCEYSSISIPDARGRVNIQKDDKQGVFELDSKKITWY